LINQLIDLEKQDGKTSTTLRREIERPPQQDGKASTAPR
jgi:hypothetical protein